MDAPGNTVYFANNDGRILAYSLNTFVPKGSLTFPSNSNFTRMIKCGNTLAIVAQGKLLLSPTSAVN